MLFLGKLIELCSIAYYKIIPSQLITSTVTSLNDEISFTISFGHENELVAQVKTRIRNQ